ncbi:MAG: NADH-quinone oxidoreductase subunit NuoE [Bacteroidales bacterium]|nr:NADH-quinone oxidoreductase subunit NuoE [Bacteroidales bacterium]
MRINRIQNQIRETEEESSKLVEDLSLIDLLIKKYKNKHGNLIPLLQGVQSIYGYIPRDAFFKLNKEVGLELSAMYGVATFYSQFRLNPVGKHIIKVCHGTACHVQDASKITDALMDSLKINDGETTEDNMFTLESVACLGCCSLAPVMMIGEETYGKLTNKSSVKVIKNIKIQESKATNKE